MTNVWEEICGRSSANSDVVVWDGRPLARAELGEAVAAWDQCLSTNSIGPGTVVAVAGDFSPGAVALLLALFARACIVVPQVRRAPREGEENASFREAQRRYLIAHASVVVELAADDTWTLTRLDHGGDHLLFEKLRRLGHAGIVLFSSGSTGESKASVLDVERLVEKFKNSRANALRTLSFLLFDHIGGINTLLATLLTGGVMVVPVARDVDTVCRTIEGARVQVLPASPSFLRLLLMTDAVRRFDLSSIQLITYGTEPMHESTLRAINAAFPGVRCKQTYGLTELGIFRTSSRADDSVWVRIGGEGVETKVVDGLLHVRTPSAMLGYLNAPQPFDQDGWYCTGDLVEVDGPYFLIRGRESEIINVGGEKVFPAEVENVLMQLDNVADVTVAGKRNPVMGHVVMATVVLGNKDEAPAQFETRARAFCRAQLELYKVPMVFNVVDSSELAGRFKKARRSTSELPPTNLPPTNASTT